MLIIGLLLGVMSIKKFRRNADRSADSAVSINIKPDMNLSTPYIGSAATAAGIDINCQPNIAHELSISVNTEYLYIIPN